MKRIGAFFFFLALLFPAGAAAQAEETVGLRMIVVRTEAEASAILARLRAGERFEDLAKTQSIDPSAREGGYLGALTISQLRPEFQAALEGIKPGQISPIARLDNRYALFQLIGEEDTRLIDLKKWIDAGADRRSPLVEGLWGQALEANDTGMVKKLLDAGVDVNAAFGDGSTVLMGAAQAGQMEIVRALLAARASVNAKSLDGTTALLVASQAGRSEIVRVLLSAGADVNARKNNGVTPLIDAAFGGHLETVRVLLESGANPNLTLEDGSTALMAASVKGQNDIVQALLKAGAQVNAGFKTGGTALMEAAYAGKAETVRILLAAGADPKVANPSGLTALMGAAFGGHTGAVQALLDAGVDAGARDAKGWTALTYARASASPAAVRMVLARTSDISAQERSLALGGTYINEYYSSNEAGLLELASAEFQKVISVQPQNAAALEWMGAVEFLRWDKPPNLQQFRRANSLLKRSVDIDPKDPDRHYWIAATNSMFASMAKEVPPADAAAIVDQGIEHARKAIEIDPQFADALDHLGVLYRQKAQQARTAADREELLKSAATAQQDAVRIRARLGNRPSRFNDQFSRPALPPPPI